MLTNALPIALRHLLAQAAATAQAQSAAVWLVGGVVRDLLLGVPATHDLDLAIEGDAVALAHTLAAHLGGRVAAQHEAFGTATVVVERESAVLSLDLARTRTEYYPAPAALPVVHPASIRQDLFRRDFSINAMALELRSVQGRLAEGPLLDPAGGAADLRAGILRVLHERSFVDDPTRILRGLRLLVRLGMSFDQHSQALLDTALEGGSLEATSPDRVRSELCLALEEPHPAAVLQQANALHITPHIFAPLAMADTPPPLRTQRTRRCSMPGCSATN